MPTDRRINSSVCFISSRECGPHESPEVLLSSPEAPYSEEECKENNSLKPTQQHR
jgi:hypothetical protein